MCLRDLNVIKQMNVKDFEHFPNHRSFLDERADTMFGNSLVMMHGEKWHDMRATLSPAFTGSKMRLMFELVTETASDMADYFRSQTTAADGQPIDTEIKELFSKYANDVIASTAFGIKVNSFKDKNNEFYTTGKMIQNFTSLKQILKIILLLVWPKVYRFFRLQFIDRKAAAFFKSMILDTIDVRTKNGIFRPDMVNIIMQLRNGLRPTSVDNVVKEQNDGFATTDELSIGSAVSATRQWTDDELVAQCFLFFLGGFDTSSTALAFAAYELAINPDIQERLYREVAETNGKIDDDGDNKRRLSYDELQRMRYLDQVVTETLRKWPVAAVLDRVCAKDYEYNDGDRKFTIHKGMLIWIPVHGIHHDPKYYPEPERFDPERFSDEQKGNIVAGSYLPFGVGPRNCIGW